jgi:hypothetical protein
VTHRTSGAPEQLDTDEPIKFHPPTHCHQDFVIELTETRVNHMDRALAKQAIERIEAEKAVHDVKFAGRPEHVSCLPRFDRVLANLYTNIEPFPRMDATNSIGALPDAIEIAKEMEEVAQHLAATNDMQAALILKREAETVIFKELNDIDGFDR